MFREAPVDGPYIGSRSALVNYIVDLCLDMIPKMGITQQHMTRRKKMLSLALEPELLEKLDAWIGAQAPPPRKTAVVETAVEMFLKGAASKMPAQLRPEYRCWWNMIKRCTSPDSPGYRHYGGRGISVCNKWRRSFPGFLADMGPRPSPAHSIERINNDGNYEPDNCRWATAKEQANNKRDLSAQEVECRKLAVALVKKRCDYPGGQSAFARLHGFTRAYVSAVIKGKSQPSRKLCAALGLRSDGERWTRA